MGIVSGILFEMGAGYGISDFHCNERGTKTSPYWCDKIVIETRENDRNR